MDNFSIATEATKMALDSQGSAMKENERYLNSLEGRLGTLKGTAEEFYSSFMKSEAFSEIIAGVTGFIKVVEWMITNLPIIPIILTAIIFKMGGLKKQVTLVSSAIKMFNQGMKGIEIEGTSTAHKIGASFKNLLTTFKQIPVAMSIAKAEGKGLGAALHLVGISSGVATAGVVALEAALTLGLAVAVTAVVTAISTWISKMANASKIRKENIAKIEEEKKSIREQVETLQELGKEYDNLINKFKDKNLNTEQFEQLKSVQDEIIAQFPELKNGITGEIEEHKKVSKAIEEKVKKLEEQYAIQRKLLMFQATEELESLGKQKKKLEVQYAAGIDTSVTSLYLEAELKNLEKLYEKQDDKTSEYAKELWVKMQKIKADISLAKANFEIETEKIKAEVTQQAKNIADGIVAEYEETYGDMTSEGKQFLYNALANIVDIDYNEFLSKQGSFDLNTLITSLIKASQDTDFTKFKDEYIKAFTSQTEGKINPQSFNKIAKEIRDKLTKQISEQVKDSNQVKIIVDDLMRQMADSVKEGSSNMFAGLLKTPATLMDEFKDIVSVLGELKDIQDRISEKDFTPSASDIEFITSKFADLLPYMNDIPKLQEEINKKFAEQEKMATEAYRAILFSNEEFTKNIVENNSEQINELAEMYKIDRDNWTTLAEFKLQIDQSLIKQLAGAWAEYYDIQGNLQESSFRRGIFQLGEGPLTKKDQEVLDEAYAIQEEIQKRTKDNVDRLNAIANVGTFKFKDNDKKKGALASDFNQDYMIEYGAEVDKINAKLELLNAQYKNLQGTTDSYLAQQEKLNEIIDLQVEKQKAIAEMAEKIRGKKEELEGSMIALGIDPNLPQDTIDELFKTLSKENKRAFNEQYKDWKQLRDESNKASVEWWNLENDNIAKTEEFINLFGILHDKKFRLYEVINAKINETNTLLEKNQVKADALEENDIRRKDLINERIGLLKKEQSQIHDLAEEFRKERDEELVPYLEEKYKIQFVGTGDEMTTNITDALKKQQEAVEKARGTSAYAMEEAKLQDLIKNLMRFFEIQSQEIPKAQIQWKGLDNEIKGLGKTATELYTNILSSFNDAQENLGEVFKDAISKRRDIIEEEFDKMKEAVEDKIDELERAWDEADFEKDEEKQKEAINDLVRRKNELLVAVKSGDLSAMSKLAEIEKKEDAERERLEELRTGRQRELRKQELKDKIDTAEKAKNKELKILDDIEDKQKLMATSSKMLFANTLDEYETLLKGFLTKIGYAEDEVKKIMKDKEAVTTSLYEGQRGNVETLQTQGITESNVGNVITSMEQQPDLHPLQRVMSPADWDTYIENKYKATQEYEQTNRWDSPTQIAYRDENAKIREQYNIKSDDVSWQEVQRYYKGFATGGINDKRGLYALHGTSSASEVIFNSTDAKKLFDFVNTSRSITERLGLDKLVSTFKGGTFNKMATTDNININFESLLNVQGNVGEDSISKLKSLVDKASNIVVSKIRNELSKSGFKR